MEIFLIICLASGLASSEKLDRSYLPPPGSKFSGGTPGDIETPLEFPKQSIGPQIGNGRPDIDLGINRRPAPSTGTPESQKPGFNYFQKSYPVPKTTTSYAITQSTTFAPDEQYAGGEQPSGFLNGSTVQSGFPGQNQSIRKQGQGPYNQYHPGQSQTSIIGTYGTTARPKFPGVFSGPEYLPPVSHKQSPAQVISKQDGSGYPSGLPQGTKYQDGQAISANRPDYVPQQNQYDGNLNIPSTASPEYQGGRFVPTEPGSQQSQNQFTGNQFPSSTAAPQYQDGQRFFTPGFNQKNQFTGRQLPSSTAVPQYQDGQRLITPGSNQLNQFTGSQFPSSTAAPQYQGGQRLFTPGSKQQDQFTSIQDFPSSTASPQSQFGQRFTTPGLFGAPLPNQQNQFTGYQYPGNQNFPSSTAAPTPGSIEQNQFTGNKNFPSTAAPNYQDRQRFTTPGQIQDTQFPGQPGFGSRVPSQGQNQFVGQNFPTSTSAPQFQDGTRLTTPGYVQEGYGSPVLTQQNQNQYPGNQNYPSSTTAPQYQNGQQFTTPGSVGNQNFPSTAAPDFQGGQRFTTPDQFLDQQRTGSRLPGQQSIVNQNSPLSTAPQYQDGQQFSTPGAQDRFESPQPNQHNKYPGSYHFPTSTAAPQYEDGQRFSTPGSEPTFGTPQRNQYGNQKFPTSTAAPQYQGQRNTTPGQIFNQPNYPDSTTAQQYQQKFVPTPGTNHQQGVIPSQQDQFQRPVFNQQFPSSTTAPQKFVHGSQPQYGNYNNIPTPGAEAAFPGSLGGLPEGQTYGDIRQPTSQTGVGSLSGTGAAFPSTTIGSLPARDFASTPGLETIGGGRSERPQAEGDRNAEILSYENKLTPDSYFYSYDTSNGIHADETGTLGNGTRAQGGFSYTGDDGKVYSVVYSADENGFQPRGDHLPTPPPIPEAIQRIIDQANKGSGIDDDGSYNEEKYGYMKYEGPFSRLKPQSKIASLVNGADIPSETENRVGEQTKKTPKNRGRKPVSNTGNRERFEPDYEVTDANGSETDEMDVNEGNRRPNDNNDKNRRISSKRPKPIKDLTLEDNRAGEFKGIKMTMKPTSNSKIGSLHKNKETERNGPRHRPISSEGNEESVSDDITEESEDNDDLKESQGFDYDSDLVNYKDDPIHRTDFHGFNKYLPESKQNNRKNEFAKKRPNVRLNGKKQSIGVSEVETPEDRNNQESEDSRPDFVDESRTRIPSRKNKINQRVKELSKVTGQPGSDDETNSYSDNRTYTDEDGSDDARKPVTNDRVSKPGTSQLKNKTSGKLKRPNVNDRTDLSDDKGIKSSSYEDNGYEYTPPQRKFGSEEAIKFPSRVNEKVAQTTLRPFITKNVYGDEDEPADDYNGEYDAEKTGRGRPMIGQKQYPGYNQDGESYNQNNPKVNKDERFSSTRRPISYGTSRPSGKPQTTGTPKYHEDGVSGQIYNEPAIQSQRPGDKLFYSTNAPNRGTGGNVFSSTTPLPPSGPGSSRYQRPSYQNRPTDGSYYGTIAPAETYGANVPSGQLPSTTYRPNYSFGAKISPVTVDDSGRPIQRTNAPTFDRTPRPNYSTVRPSESENRPSDAADQFRPTEGRFGVTSTQGMSGYQSTSAPGEDFSGPMQPQRFDPKTGYHYK